MLLCEDYICNRVRHPLCDHSAASYSSSTRARGLDPAGGQRNSFVWSQLWFGVLGCAVHFLWSCCALAGDAPRVWIGLRTYSSARRAFELGEDRGRRFRCVRRRSCVFESTRGVREPGARWLCCVDLECHVRRIFERTGEEVRKASRSGDTRCRPDVVWPSTAARGRNSTRDRKSTR